MDQHRPGHPTATMRKLYDTIRSLKQMPLCGRVGLEGTREIVLSPLPYIVVYRLRAEAVEVAGSTTLRKTGRA